jgi:hypothetical protein
VSTASQRARLARDAARRFTSDVASAGGGVRLSINDDDAANTRGFDRIFVGLGATLDGLEEVLADPQVVRTIRDGFHASFDRQGGRTRWPALAPRTVEERRRLGFPPRRPILERTGALRRHVVTTPAVTRRTPSGAELRIEPGNVVDGVPKYRALAKGSPSSNLPARPMVVLTPDQSARVAGAISRALRQRAARLIP